MEVIRYHMKEPAVQVLGPGSRYVLWVQGCPKDCPGCIAPDSHPIEGGSAISVQALAWEIAVSGADGMTISGGEPFLQATSLAKLIRLVRKHRDMGTIVYTGYRYEELAALPGGPDLVGQTDLLIDGEYIQELDDREGLFGSSNQRAIPLTNRYRDVAESLGAETRIQERFAHGLEIHDVGLPGGIYLSDERSVAR